MKLNTLSNNYGAKKSRIRRGRGIGSGKGKTCGRGGKGQTARSGVAIKGFEGGQTPIIKRLPKRGFNCPSSVTYQVISLSKISSLIEKGSIDASNVITKDLLLKLGLIKNLSKPVKLLSGEFHVKEKISVKFDAYSAQAKKLISEVGGQVL